MGKKKARNKEKSWTYGEVHDRAREMGIEYDSIEWDSRDDRPRLVNSHGETVAHVVAGGEIVVAPRVDVFGRNWTWNGMSWETEVTGTTTTGEDLRVTIPKIEHDSPSRVITGSWTTSSISVEAEVDAAEPDGRSAGYDDPAVLRAIIRELVWRGTVDDSSPQIIAPDGHTTDLDAVLDEVLGY